MCNVFVMISYYYYLCFGEVLMP